MQLEAQEQLERFSEVENEGMGPLDAIDFLRDKKVVKKQDFELLAEEYRPYAFTVAHVESISTLTLAQGELGAFLSSGESLGEFQATIADAFQRRGITPLAPHHIENVFRTNMQTAYNAGRWNELMDPEMATFFPMFEYHNPLDERSRLTHAAMAKPGANRFRRDDPIWFAWWPPNGYNCRCWVVGVSDPRAMANTPQGSFIDEQGQHQPLLPDTGFSHNPGLPEGRAQVIRGLLDRTLNP